MKEAIFALDADGVAHASTLAAGPWDPSMQHGGAPAALIARAAERAEAPAPMHVARLTIDLLRPVPLAPIAVRTEVVRQGRAIQVLAIELFAADKLVARATALRIRAADNTAAAIPDPFDGLAPEASAPVDRALRLSSGFMRAMEIRMARGEWHVLGPAAAWYRMEAPVVAGEETTPLMRAAAAADTCSGLSAALPFDA